MKKIASSYPLVSVVIPTLNCAGIIEECLESIKMQTYPNIEIVVVDSHSQDDTREIAKKHGAKVFVYGPKQTAPFEKVFGAPYQRNYGVDQARGKYVYYVDSDMRLTPTVIEECITRIEKENADAAIVPEFSYGEGFWAQCRVLEKACYYEDKLVDAARFIRKEVWDKLGGLDASLGGGDDWDFQHRLDQNGYKTIHVRSNIRHYEGRLSLSKQLRKKYVYGKTVDRYFKKHRDHKWMLIKQYSLFRPAYFRNWRKFVKDPMHGVGLSVMKTLEYISALLGLVSAKFAKREVSLNKKGI